MTANASGSRPTVVCVTPIKNEAHNLPRFLACASLWADRIIVADQQSEDNSAQLVRAHPKATLIQNESPDYNERERQKLLLDAARQVPGPRVIVAMDADEILPTPLFCSPVWDKVLSAAPGTVAQLRFVHMLPGLGRAWGSFHWQNRIYVDDGRPHSGQLIHSSPVPVYPDSPLLQFPESLLLHYALADAARFARRRTWYQCYELLNSKDFGPIQIYRRYHVFDALPKQEMIDVDPAWFTAYERAGIDVRHIEPSPTRQWDRDIFAWMTDPKIGRRRFTKLAIWDVDWNREYEKFAGKPSPVDLSDPRSWCERRVHQWLADTQKSEMSIPVRVVQRVLRMTGW